MSDFTRELQAAKAGDPKAAERLLPLVYDELRRLAAAHLARERPGQTLQPTALVHEVWLKLTDGSEPPWNGRGHFFAAAATAVRRILVDRAREKRSLKRGGGLVRQPLETVEPALPEPREDLLALDEALDRLAAVDPQAASLVQLRYFAGLSTSQAAEQLGVSPRTAARLWEYARAWLRTELETARAT